MKEIAKIHVITQDNIPGQTHASLAEEACAAGAEWIQLRVKNADAEKWRKIAEEVQFVCQKYSAKFIINDHVQLAKELGADGVHIGKNDMPVSEARAILGDGFIIGGTANTIDDIKAIHQYVDYIGLGPFRFTSTKENLSPVLGLNGYKEIITQCKAEGINKPVIAIGGIEPKDVPAILETGIYGIAVASAINTAKDKEKAFGKFEEAISFRR